MKRPLKILVSTLALAVVTVLCLSYLYASSSDDQATDKAHVTEHCPHGAKAATKGAHCPYAAAHSETRSHSSCSKWMKEQCADKSECTPEERAECDAETSAKCQSRCESKRGKAIESEESGGSPSIQ